MTPQELIQTLHERGVSVRVDGDRLVCSPSSAVQDLREVIREKKPDIIKHLKAGRDQARQGLIDLYAEIGNGCTGQDWSALCEIHGWKETVFLLEESFTVAWQSGGDCGRELERLKDHWTAGIGAIRKTEH